MTKKQSKLYAILFVLFGILWCASLLIAQFIHCYDFVNTEIKGKEYTAFEYFLEVSGAAIAFSITTGIIFVSIGIFLYIHSRKIK